MAVNAGSTMSERIVASTLGAPPPKPVRMPDLARKAGGKRSQLQMEAAKRHGLRGVIVLPNGDKYKGEWEDDKRHGKGKLTSPNGAVYDGDWANDMREGYGVVTVPGTTPGSSSRIKRYAGGWRRDRRWGNGTNFYGDDGLERYEGEWYAGERSGWGRMYYTDGSVYEGEWLRDERCGRGLHLLANRDRYEGEWAGDKKHGEGVYFYLNKGTCYRGVWKDGSPKCGEVFTLDPSAPDAPKYELPELKLADPDAVLDAAAREHGGDTDGGVF